MWSVKLVTLGIVAAAVVTLVYGLALGSCAATSDGSSSSVDAAIDHRRLDVTAVDASGGDDTATPSFVDGWVPAPWANPPCLVYQPGSASALASVSPLKWQACTSNRPGCEEIVHDWVTEGSVNSIGGSWSDIDGSSFLLVERGFSLTNNEFLLYRDDVLVWAWRHLYTGMSGCLGGPGSLMAGQVTLDAIVRDSNSHIVEYRQLVSTPLVASAISQPTYVFPSAGDGGFGNTLITTDVASLALVAMWEAQGGKVAIRDRSTNTLHTFWDDPTNQADDVPVVVGDSAFYANGRPGKVFLYTPTTGIGVLRQSANGVYVHDVASDGINVAWIESSGNDGQGNFTASTLFVSPYTHGSLALTPAALDNNICLGSFCGMTMSDGYLLVDTYSAQRGSSVNVYRLADHTRWRLSALAAHDELGHAGGVLKGRLWLPSRGLGNVRGISRIDISALGAGETAW